MTEPEIPKKKPTLADVKRRLINEGADIDALLAENSSGGEDSAMPKPPEEDMEAVEEEEVDPVEEEMPVDPEVAAEVAEVSEPVGMGEAEKADLIEHGTPDTWTIQTIQRLPPARRAAAKAAWAKASPEEQDAIRAAIDEKKSGPKKMGMTLGGR